MTESASTERDVSRVLTHLRTDRSTGAEELLPLVYQQLRRMAESQLRAFPPGQTLQATALVHEAWLRVVGAQDPGWDCREHFFCAAARAIREILIESLRSKRTLKRDGGKRSEAELDQITIEVEVAGDDVLKVHHALEELEAGSPELAKLVSLRYFAGISMSECAEVLQMPLRTAERRWSLAKLRMQDLIMGLEGA